MDFFGKRSVLLDVISALDKAGRLCYFTDTKACSGVQDIDLSTKSLDLSISKGFAIFTPYAGYGVVQIDSKEKSTLVNLQDVSTTEGKGFIGFKLTFFPFMNLVAEADFAKVNSYSGRLNIHF